MEFIKGMDISFLPEMINLGAKFLDSEGNMKEIFELLKENGVNSIRLRIWNEPKNVPESGGYCSLEETISMAKRVKNAGMSFFLDFHYSDWWADPGKQEKPRAWQKLSFEELKTAVYEYTKEVLLKMDEEGVYPDLVQIGNEIRSGMLFPEGEIPNYLQLVQLVNAGITAVRESAGERDTKIVIHLDQGGRYFYLKEWFDAALAAGLEDFDIIGVSYYPFWHGTFAEFKSTLVKLIKRYEKPIIVAETAHAWRRAEDGFVGEQQEKIAGFSATPEAQRQVMDLVMNITASLESEMGLGIYYWEPVVLPVKGKGGWCSNMGIFQEDGKALTALSSFRFDRTKLKINEIAKIYEPEPITVQKGSNLKLPESVRVLYYSGELIEMKVEWDNLQESENTEQEISNYRDNNENGKADGSISEIGIKMINGILPELRRQVQAEINVVEELEEGYNYLRNSDFSEGLTGFIVTSEDARVVTEICQDFSEPFPAPPINYIYVVSPVNFTWKLEGYVEGLKAGKYCLAVDYRGTNTTGVDVKLFAGKEIVSFAEDEKKRYHEMSIFPTDEDWITYRLENISVDGDSIKIGIKIASPPVFGKICRLKLTRQE